MKQQSLSADRDELPKDSGKEGSKGFSALILAAGRGVRMKSVNPKVVHAILGKPMVSYVVDAVRSVGAGEVIVIVGFGKDRLMQALDGHQLSFVEQAEQLGTGHAVQCYAKAHSQVPNHLLVVCGDTPLLSRKTLQEMVDTHFHQNNDVTMMTLEMEEPGGYGRILRDEKGRAKAIREAKDCSPEEKKVREINLAVYLFKGKDLFDRLPRLKNTNHQKEYYLTDLIEMMYADGLKIETVREHDESSTLGINSRLDMAKVSDIMKKQILSRHMENGVTVVDPAQTLIEPDVEIGADTVIYPGTTLSGKTTIGSNAIIGPQAFIKDSRIGKGVTARCCCLEKAEIHDGEILPPFSAFPLPKSHPGKS